MIKQNNMENEVIDLTNSPLPEYIVIDADEEPVITTSEKTPVQSEASRDGGRKKVRRKKRKRSVVEGDSLSSVAQTRETSLEEGEVETSTPREEKSLLSTSNRKAAVEVGLEQHHKSRRGTELSPQNQHSRRSSRSPRRKRTPPSEPSPSDSNLFFIDVNPTPLPITSIFVVPTIVDNQAGPSLLLPAHVSVFGATPVEILPSPNANSDEEDYIDYLDFDDRKDVVRYFETPIDEIAKKPRILCKHCGAEGDHKTSDCSVLICLTCGARNEHPTRSCPISKTCFSCGMKGHINATCPNRKKGLNPDLSKYDDCDRCGSRLHKTNECPTLWRLYEYFTDQDKDHIVRIREERKHLTLGQGGEGYIASDEWCYNCGSCGHWGDDCQDVPHNKDLPNEQSAFSTYNTRSGPFYDPHSESVPSTSSRHGLRDWEHDNNLPGDWGSNAPDNVGKQARQKNIAKMEKRAQEQAVDDDPDDWFGHSRKDRSHKPPSRSSTNAPSGAKRMSFGKTLQDAGRQFQAPPPAKPSLLDRLGDNIHRGHSRDPPSRSSRSRHDRDYGSRSHSRRDDKYAQDRDRDRYRSREEPGPRYKGGYKR